MIACPKRLRDFEVWCSYCGRLVKGRNILWLKDGYGDIVNAGCIHCKKKVLRAFDKALRELRKERKRLLSARAVLGELRKEVKNGTHSCSR